MNLIANSVVLKNKQKQKSPMDSHPSGFLI